MKRWISLLLCLTMAGSLLPFALADEETADARLKRVTEQVKTTLDLDTDQYTEFRGSPSEQELGTIWNLNWSGGDSSMSIEALEDGTVVSYWLSDGGDRYTWTQNLPTFPDTDAAKAREAASAFLDKVLDKRTESVNLKESEDRQLRSTSVRFYGTLLLNGLPSPLSYSITVRGSDSVVTNFRRDAPSNTFLGNIPSPVPAVTKADAAALLRDTEKLELLYVLDEAAQAPTARQTGAQASPAKPVLRYVPKSEGTWAVDAQTGEVKDITGGGIGLYRTNAAATAEEAAMDAGGNLSMKSLNAVELEGVEKLEGVLDQAALDRAIRAEAAYQLSDAYAVQSANYRLVKEDDGQGGEIERVICTLFYTAGQSEDIVPLYQEEFAVGAAIADTAVKADLPDHTFTVDARTGAVQMLYTSERWNPDRTVSVPLDRAMETARNFLFRFAASAPVDAARLELRDTSDNTADGAASYGFTFARKENGVFFPADSITIRVDCVTGAVTGLNYAWHENLSSRDFPSPAGVVSADAALTAWAGTYDAVLAYRLLPRDLDRENPTEAKLISLGMTKFYDMFLSYGLERPEDSAFVQYNACPGIDAKTGQPVDLPAYQAEKLEYSDISGSAAEADILKLAEYGIGYAGGAFQPSKRATQWDLVCLLASVQGFRINPDEAADDEKNSAYSTVYYMGALERKERDDGAAMTKGAAVKLLLNAAGYRSTAELSGIWSTDYLDSRTIPAGDVGYAALAQGLNMVKGTYGASAPVTRADAASMLCRLMERKG